MNPIVSWTLRRSTCRFGDGGKTTRSVLPGRKGYWTDASEGLTTKHVVRAFRPQRLGLFAVSSRHPMPALGSHRQTLSNKLQTGLPSCDALSGSSGASRRREITAVQQPLLEKKL